jgi:chromosomal replication initiation ATPase DnaA
MQKNQTRHEQFVLDLGHRTAMGRDDFLIAPSNQDAVAWIDLWPDWPAPALVLYGPPASGKSHLAAVWKDITQASYIDSETLNDTTARHLAAQSKHVILEECDRMIGDIDREKGLFHLYNILREEGRSLLLTMENPPVRLNFALPDLASRLRAAPCVSIREPDEILLGAVLVKLFNDRQLRVGADVIRYILSHMERSFEEARRIVDQADKRAMTDKKGITPLLIKSFLFEANTHQ